MTKNKFKPLIKFEAGVRSGIKRYIVWDNIAHPVSYSTAQRLFGSFRGDGEAVIQSEFDSLTGVENPIGEDAYFTTKGELYIGSNEYIQLTPFDRSNFSRSDALPELKEEHKKAKIISYKVFGFGMTREDQYRAFDSVGSF